MASVQRPSATSTFLAGPEDAITLLEAARIGLIPRTTRRLTRGERADLIDDGAVFIWEEQETQMQRWTDGRRWSCSRVMGEFLAYDEVVPCGGPSAKRSGAPVQTCRLENGLIKQSFALTFSDDSPSPRKYHIISYSRSQSMHLWKRPSQQAEFRHLDLSLWNAFPPIPSTSTSSHKAVPSRNPGPAPGKSSSRRSTPKEMYTFSYNPHAAASASSLNLLQSGSSSSASTPSGSDCCPPKQEPSSPHFPSASTRSTSPSSVRSPSHLRVSNSRPPSMSPYDYPGRHQRPDSSSTSAAAASLLGLGGAKLEPYSTLSAPVSRTSSPRFARRRSHSPTIPPGHSFTSSAAPAVRSPHLLLPHPYQPRATMERDDPMIHLPATRPPPPWLAPTLDQEDKRMLSKLPFRI